MELHFSKSVCQCLQKVLCQVQTQEQTQEVRLPDTLPDIGRVLGSWGQVVIRGKEWRGNGMSVSGGVMVWILYAPEDGTPPQSIDCWIPLQMKWDFPQTQRDGAICVVPLLKGVDARSVSARKLMVRTTVSILGEALEPVEKELYTPSQQLPEDVQLLRRTYPAQLPEEAGEKAFHLEEELIFPPSIPAIRKILRFELLPQITEEKVLAGRLVFRGNAALHILYMADDDTLHTWDWELPFSQYTELDQDYGPNAAAWIVPIVTGAELERGDDVKWMLKGGVSAQYVIYDRVMLETVEDAYSPFREIAPQIQTLDLPICLDTHSEDMNVQQDWDVQGQRIAEVVWYPEHPRQQQNGDVTQLEIPGQFQVLYYDAEGQLQGGSVHSRKEFQIQSDPNSRLDCYLYPFPGTSGTFTADGGQLNSQFCIRCMTGTVHGLSMVTGLALGEQRTPDPARPSLILRRAGDESLWSIAKGSGSTVEAIMKANALTDEPNPDIMLLVPVI